MISKCEKCHKSVTWFGAQMCRGLLCTKIYCHSCFQSEFSQCSCCKQSPMCPLCVMVWDICPQCLGRDNAKI